MKADKPTVEDITRLKAWIEANDFRVYTVIRSVSRSGMSREISVVIPIISHGRTQDYDATILKTPIPDHVASFVHPSYTVAGILGWRYSEKNGHNAVIVSGCGMDMGFHLIYSLSSALYDGDGYKIKQEWI
jgi:hypothetical protein